MAIVEDLIEKAKNLGIVVEIEEDKEENNDNNENKHEL